MNISDKLTTDLIINTFQYLFDFLFPLERSTSLLPTSAPVRNTTKCCFCFFSNLSTDTMQTEHRRSFRQQYHRLNIRRNNTALKVTRYLFASTNMVTFLRCRCLITFLLAYSETA